MYRGRMVLEPSSAAVAGFHETRLPYEPQIASVSAASVIAVTVDIFEKSWIYLRPTPCSDYLGRVSVISGAVGVDNLDPGSR